MIRLSNDDVKISGSTMTGDLFLNTNAPTVNEQAASKKYVDDQLGGGGGGAVAVEENGSTVVTSASTLNYGLGFDVSDAGSGQADLTFDISETTAVRADNVSQSISGTKTFLSAIESPSTEVLIGTDADSTVIRRSNNTGFLSLAGGSTTSITQGAAIALGGNSDATQPGRLFLSAGNTGDGIFLGTFGPDSSQVIHFTTRNVERWQLDGDGHWAPQSNDAYDIGNSTNGVRNVYIAGTIFDNSDSSGSNGQVLKSDGAGGLTWGNDAGAPSLDPDKLLRSDPSGDVAIISGWNVDQTSAGHIIPNTNNVTDIGSTSFRLRTVYTGEVSNAGILDVKTTNTSQLRFGTQDGVQWEIDSAGALQPTVNDTYDLGTAGRRIANGFYTTVDAVLVDTPEVSNNGILDVKTRNTSAVRFGTQDGVQWEIDSAGALQPTVNNTYNLGTAGRFINNAWFNNLFAVVVDTPEVSNTGLLDLLTNDGSALRFGSNGSIKWELDSNGDLQPILNNTYDLGTVSRRVAIGYFTTANATTHVGNTFESSGSMVVGTEFGNDLEFKTSDTVRWKIEGGSGDFVAQTTNTHDIGNSRTANAPRTVYAGTSMSAPTMVSNSFESGGSMQVGTNFGNDLEFKTSDTVRWRMDAGGGHFEAETHNTYDIGTNVSTNAPRNIYAATKLESPTLTYGAGPLVIEARVGAQQWPVTFETADTDRWSISGSGQFTGLQTTNVITSNTSNGSDNAAMMLLAAGTTNSSGRGAAVVAYGNEHANTGELHLVTGNPASRMVLNAIGSSGEIHFFTDNTLRWKVDSAGLLEGQATTNIINTSTSDGSDNSAVYILGGGSTNDASRGAGLLVFGNEHSGSPGEFHLFTGTTASRLVINGTGASTDIEIYTNSTLRWNLNSSGHLEFGADGVYDLGTSSTHARSVYSREFARNDGSDLVIDSHAGDVLINWGNIGNRLRMTDNCVEPVVDQGLNLGGVGNVWNGLSVNTIEGHSISGLSLHAISGTDILFRGNSSSTPSLTSILLITNSGNIEPFTDGLQDIGTDSLHFGSFYSNQLSMKPAAAGWSNHVISGSTTASGTLNIDGADSNTTVVDIINSGSGTAQLKVNGTVVNVPFTGKHIYKSGNSSLKAGDPVKLVNGQLQPCGDADVACIGVMTGEVLTTVASGNYIYDSYNNSYDHDELNPKVLQHVAAHGDTYCEGLEGITVTDESGPVYAGDRLCTTSDGKFRKWISGTDPEFSKKLWVPEDIQFVDGEANNIYAYFVNQ